jgi:hypothetical protein
MGKRFTIIFICSSTISAEPQIAGLVFHDASNIIIREAFLFREIGKGFAIILTYAAAPRTEPEITELIFPNSINIITAEAFLLRKIGKRFAIILTCAAAEGTEPRGYRIGSFSTLPALLLARPSLMVKWVKLACPAGTALPSYLLNPPAVEIQRLPDWSSRIFPVLL